MAIAQQTIEEIYFNDAFPRPALVGQGPMPTSDELWLVATGEAPEDLRFRVLEYCVKCPAGAEELRVARQMVQALEQEEAALSKPSFSKPSFSKPQLTLIESGGLFAPESVVEPRQVRPKTQDTPINPQLLVDQASANETSVQSPKVVSVPARNHARRFAGVAALCSAVAGVMLYVRAEQGTAPAEKLGADAPAGTLRGAVDLDQAPQATDLSFKGSSFVWSSLAKGATFEVETYDASFQAICTLPASAAHSVELSTKLCPNFDPSKPFYWKVRTIGAGGRSSTSAATYVDPKAGK